MAETNQDVDYYYRCGNEVLQLPDGRCFYAFVDQDVVDEDAYLGAPASRTSTRTLSTSDVSPRLTTDL